MGKKPKQIMYDCHTERKEKLLIFFLFGSQWPKKLFHFFEQDKKQKNPPYNILNWKNPPIKFPQI